MDSRSDRPGGPKVFGVLSIVFASMTIFSSLLGGCSLGMTRGGAKGAALGMMAAGPGGSSALAEAYGRYYEQTFVASAGQVLLLLALSILLLFIGIGQLRYRRWSCWASQAWAGAAMIALVGMMVLSYTVFRPASQALVSALIKGMRAGAAEGQIMSWVSSLMGGGAVSWAMVIFYLPYPLLLLIYFSRPVVRAAMVEE